MMQILNIMSVTETVFYVLPFIMMSLYIYCVDRNSSTYKTEKDGE